MAVPHSVHATPPPPLQRHGVKLKKLNRPADQRKAMLRSLTTELIRYGRIRSTLAKCKEVRQLAAGATQPRSPARLSCRSHARVPSPFPQVRTTADHMVTLAKDGSLHARRQALGYIYDKELVHALFEQVRGRPDTWTLHTRIYASAAGFAASRCGCAYSCTRTQCARAVH